MACCNFQYLKSLSGIFRLLSVLTGIPLITLAWIAYFSSSWTNVWPEILAILAVEKNSVIAGPENSVEQDGEEGATTSVSVSSSKPPGGGGDSSEELDIISDKEEEYLDEIILQTLMYEKFFIGIVSVVFLMSTAYLILRIMSAKHHEDSPYEIMFDFIFHVLCALGLLTGSGLVLMSAAKIKSFVEQVENRDGFAPPEIVQIIHENKDNVQDEVDKIAAAVVGMVNGIFYALCVVTVRMTNPVKCKTTQKKGKNGGYKNKNGLAPYHQHPHSNTDNDIPIFSVMPLEYQQQLREQQQQQNREIQQNDPYFLPHVLPRRSIPHSYE